MIEFTLTRSTPAPIETVFDVMTDHRAAASLTWLFRRSTLERDGSPAPNGVGAIRHLESFGTTFVEEIVIYERPTRWAYSLRSGAPVRDHRGTIDLRRAGSGTAVSWRLQGTLTIPGLERLMLPVFRAFIAELLRANISAAESAPARRSPSG